MYGLRHHREGYELNRNNTLTTPPLHDVEVSRDGDDGVSDHLAKISLAVSFTFVKTMALTSPGVLEVSVSDTSLKDS